MAILQAPTLASEEPLNIDARPRIVVGHAQASSGCSVMLDREDVHLLALDCEAVSASFPDRARAVLQRMVNGRRVTCVILASDAKGRQRGQCMAAGQDVAAHLVEAGWGIVRSRPGSTVIFDDLLQAYATLERHARRQKAGLWQLAEN